ncbi:MAG: hypothetical protein LBC83_00555 [Oscillospiraceae bacterium]|jgi:hypothetical protein|nr:hypothetical protein [Oscillospiraceae bacterium]
MKEKTKQVLFWLKKRERELPLAVAALTLLFGLLPLGYVPGVQPYRVSVSAYGLPLVNLAQFTVFPIALIALWVMCLRVTDFAKLRGWLLTVIGAAQIVSLFSFGSKIAAALNTRLVDELQVIEPQALAQRLTVGFYFPLALAVGCVMYGGVRAALDVKRVRGAVSREPAAASA